MHNSFGLVSMQDDVIEIKGTLYSTKVTTFNEYVAFLNLVKQDEIISQQWNTFREKFDKVLKWFYKSYLGKPIPGLIPPKINGVQIHLFDLYKLIEGFGGYLSVYFGKEFGTIGEILGLSKQDEEEVKNCYFTILLDVFTMLQQDLRGFLVRAVHPSWKLPATKGKEMIENFGVKLDEEDNDRRERTNSEQ
ncbi:ARID DNA-binding domain-containing protein [Tanacetum coccineum]